MRRLVNHWRRSGHTVAVVPTMGALHDGHLTLVRHAMKNCDRVIVTIFVNPRQFNETSDFELYPRTETADAVRLTEHGVHALYAPGIGNMCPRGFATKVSVEGITEGLCGAFRPGHFDGVATVVLKLLNQTGADVAYFGEKDFQQLQTIRRLVTDLDLPVRIEGVATVREADGLALSSRNSRLSARQRVIASSLAKHMKEACDRIGDGEDISSVLSDCKARIIAEGFEKVEYLEVRTEDTLEKSYDSSTARRLLCAAWLGNVRLIDNFLIPFGRP
ncbi:pantoate--beta-alanine ligase [Rhizobium sp. B230/85]|nr:pantoate--beta-alanine ligase [Rhizobium sp. B230/85]